jgi:hypothetical protein
MQVLAIIRGVRDHYGATRLLVEGVRWAAGFHVCFVRADQAERREYQGPLVPGPWASAYGIAASIDDCGGTKGEIEKEQAANLVLRCKLGDEVEIEGYKFRIGPASNHNISLTLV